MILIIMKDEETVKSIMKFIGDNPERVGLKDTPGRIVRMWQEIFKDYNPQKKPILTTFPNDKDGVSYNQMIIDSGYFFSHCEHHMVPFFGKYYFGYIPGNKIIGLSKVSRIVDYYSAKLQMQERLVKEIIDELESVLQPKH